MGNENQTQLYWLIPDFSNFNSSIQTSEDVSIFFVTFLIFIFICFFCWLSWNFWTTYKKLSWLNNRLCHLQREDLVGKREELIEQAKQEKKGIGFLWLEFDETLVEVCRGDRVELRNTLDAGHFFNSYTLARGITENRLLAAVPGFLTAFGVIGTFIGLQLGLSNLQLGVGANVSEMQEAMVVATQGIQNSLEQSLTTIMAPAINKLVDETADSNQKALEGLLESFMDKFGEAGNLQRQALDDVSNKVNQSVESMQQAMMGLVDQLKTTQTELGEREKALIVDISNQVNDLTTQSELIHTKLASFVENHLGEMSLNMKAREEAQFQREAELVNTINGQINELISNSRQQNEMMSNFVKSQLSSLTETFEERDKRLSNLEKERNEKIEQQTNAISTLSSEILTSVEKSITEQVNTVKQLISQGQILQNSIDASVEASVQATQAMRESSKELRLSADSMKVLSSHINEAGNKLSGAISAAVESTADLANQNHISSQRMERLRDEMIKDVTRFNELTNQLQSLIESAGSTFSELQSANSHFIANLKNEVDELNQKMLDMLEEYANQANAQTAEHLRVWSESVTDYSTQMNNAIRALSNVVDEIQVKLG
jgi:hypothetical protein